MTDARREGESSVESHVSDIQKRSKEQVDIMSETAGNLFFMERRLEKPKENWGPGFRATSPARRTRKVKGPESFVGVVEN